MVHRLAIPILLLAALTACEGDFAGPGVPPAEVMELDFTETTHGWQPGFADFPVGWEEQMDLRAGHEPLPEGLDRDGRGLFIAATNHSDDVFMFWKGRVDGLDPALRYRVRFEVEFATDSPAGCFGIGGPPGEAVWVKAAATAREPQPVVGEVGGSNYWLMNIDKGNQSGAGADAIILGDVGTEESDCLERAWAVKTLASAETLEVTPAADGSVWLLIGTDSGFEGRTELYYIALRATFEAI